MYLSFSEYIELELVSLGLSKNLGEARGKKNMCYEIRILN